MAPVITERGSRSRRPGGGPPRVPIRRKLVWLLVVAGLLPLLATGLVAAAALNRLGALAEREGSSAVAAEARARLEGLAREAARRDDLVFERARSDAVAVARYAAFIYDHPDLFPEPLQGGTPLERTAQGHLVNRRETRVGVFVPRQAEMTLDVWREVGLLSHIDTLLMSLHGRSPHVARIWITTGSRFTRIYPNIGLGHPGSPVGPDYDLTKDVFFTLAAPAANPRREPVWTPPYQDPADEGMMVTAAVPVYGQDGRFRAVAGVDLRLSDIASDVLKLRAGRDEGYALLADPVGRLVAAPDQALADLGLSWRTPAPGQAASLLLTASTSPGVRAALAPLFPGRREDTARVVELPAASGPKLLAAASLPTTGWVLGIAVPREAVLGSADATARAIGRARRQLYAAAAGAVALLVVFAFLAATRGARAVNDPVQRLARGARRFGSGDLSHRIEVAPGDELGLLAEEFNRMADRLQALHEDLEGRVEERTKALLAEERRRAIQARELAVLAERNRLSREIHDTLAQGFTGIVLQLEAAEEAFTQDSRAALAHLARARALARESLAEARRSVWNLRPGSLDGRSLAQAIVAELAKLEETGIETRIEVAGQAEDLDPEEESALLRVCQEALANLRDHAAAHRAAVRLEVTADRVTLAVEDDGRGFDPEALPATGSLRGFGLLGMRERIEALGGTLTVDSAPGRRTRVRADIPRVRVPDVGEEVAG